MSSDAPDTSTTPRRARRRISPGRVALAAVSLLAVISIASCAGASGAASRASDRADAAEATIAGLEAQIAGLEASNEETAAALADAEQAERERLLAIANQEAAAERAAQEQAAAGDGDLIGRIRSELDADAAATIRSAELDGTGRARIETSIVDPRGDDGSAEARQALAICTAAAALDGVQGVSVAEADGTSFVVFSVPSYPECTEV